MTTHYNTNLGKKQSWQTDSADSPQEKKTSPYNFIHMLITFNCPTLAYHHMKIHKRDTTYHTIYWLTLNAFKVSPSTPNSLTVWGSLGWVINWHWTPPKRLMTMHYTIDTSVTSTKDISESIKCSATLSHQHTSLAWMLISSSTSSNAQHAITMRHKDH